MNYNIPLIEAQFIKRYKRFFADVKHEGKIVVAHVPNTGSLKGVCDVPRPCRMLPSANPERKLKFTLMQVQTPTSWVGVNTHLANDLAWEAFTNKKIPHWESFSDGQREVKISKESRLDMLLTGKNSKHYVEVKNVTLAENGVALFPDSVTTRGQKHLRDLMKLHDEGATTEILFVIQRTDCATFSPADDIDPEYGRLLREAKKHGVKISAYPTVLENDRIELDCSQKIKIKL